MAPSDSQQDANTTNQLERENIPAMTGCSFGVVSNSPHEYSDDFRVMVTGNLRPLKKTKGGRKKLVS